MPKIVRAMKEMDGKPMLGDSKATLGVVFEGNNPDVIPTEAGDIAPGTGGMSVAPSIAQLPTHRIPERLKPYYKDATGKNHYVCWSLGKGEFEDGMITDELVLRVDRPLEHGLIEPNILMTKGLFQDAVAATRDLWINDEPTG